MSKESAEDLIVALQKAVQGRVKEICNHERAASHANDAVDQGEQNVQKLESEVRDAKNRSDSAKSDSDSAEKRVEEAKESLEAAQSLLDFARGKLESLRKQQGNADSSSRSREFSDVRAATVPERMSPHARRAAYRKQAMSAHRGPSEFDQRTAANTSPQTSESSAGQSGQAAQGDDQTSSDMPHEATEALQALEGAMGRVRDLESSVDTAKEKLAGVQKDMEEAAASLRKHEEAVRTAETSMQSAQDTLESARKEKERTSKALDQCRQQVREMAEEITTLNEELDRESKKPQNGSDQSGERSWENPAPTETASAGREDAVDSVNLSGDTEKQSGKPVTRASKSRRTNHEVQPRERVEKVRGNSQRSSKRVRFESEAGKKTSEPDHTNSDVATNQESASGSASTGNVDDSKNREVPSGDEAVTRHDSILFQTGIVPHMGRHEI